MESRSAAYEQALREKAALHCAVRNDGCDPIKDKRRECAPCFARRILRESVERPAAYVYLVVGYDYEDTYIESIWTTAEAADKHLADFVPDPSYASYSFGVEEHELKS